MSLSSPVFVLAPLGGDAKAIARVVEAIGLKARILATPEQFRAAVMEDGSEAVSMVVVSQEGATRETADALQLAFSSEPDWARLPVIFLVSDAKRPPPAVRQLQDGDNAPPFIVLDRPVRPFALRKAVEAFAEGRRRQFETRDLLQTLKREKERSAFLLAELRHRTSNSLTVLNSMFSLSARGATDKEHLVKSFSARLQSLSNAHALLARDDDAGAVSLAELVSRHVLPYLLDPGQLTIDGPEVRIRGRTAFDLAMVVHELATNAAKYGALSVPGGVARVSGTEGDGVLQLAWREYGGPAVVEPERRGLGRALIETFGRPSVGTNLRFAETGVSWTAQLPSTDWEHATVRDG